MTQRVLVHVGPHKTGTTYIQSLLTQNAARLAGQGVLFPRETWTAQQRAVLAVLGRDKVPGSGISTAGEWDLLLDEVRAFDGDTAVISHETISRARSKETKNVVRSLSGLEVHVVVTARDLSRVLPAMWQTQLRSRQATTWQEYIAGIRAPDRSRPWSEAFWRGHDLPELLARWRRHLPHERLHVVTVSPSASPPELLWQRFCSVLGVDPADHDLQPTRSNPSLGTAEAELLRRVNIGLADSTVDRQHWLRTVRYLARELENRPQARRFTLPEEDVAWVAARAQQIVDHLRAEGYHVVGDLDELLPVVTAGGVHPSDAREGETLDAAVAAIVSLVRKLGEDQPS